MTHSRRIDRVTGSTSVEVDSPRANGYQRRPQERLRSWLEKVEGRFMGMPLDIHPNDAILWAMRIAAGEVAYCDAQIARLEEDELFERPLKITETYSANGEYESYQEVRDVETMNRWVFWRNQAMTNMAKFAKMALDVGIEERQIQLAEKQAQQIVAVISAVLTDLGHDLRDIRTREIVRRRLMEGAIEGEVIEADHQLRQAG